jgi:hypothetical protein
MTKDQCPTNDRRSNNQAALANARQRPGLRESSPAFPSASLCRHSKSARGLAHSRTLRHLCARASFSADGRKEPGVPYLKSWMRRSPENEAGMTKDQCPTNDQRSNIQAGPRTRASVLDCGSPLPLFQAHLSTTAPKAPEDWRTPGPCGIFVREPQARRVGRNLPRLNPFIHLNYPMTSNPPLLGPWNLCISWSLDIGPFPPPTAINHRKP